MSCGRTAHDIDRIILETQRRAKQLSAALLQAGIRNGDRVATLMWNQQEHLEAYFGVPAVGAVLHTLNLRLHPEEIAYIVNHAEDRFLIVDATLLDILRAVPSTRSAGAGVRGGSRVRAADGGSRIV